jgi:hypothetical protein
MMIITSVTYPDGSGWSLHRGQDTRLVIHTNGSFSARRALELSESIELEVREELKRDAADKLANA